MQGTINQNFEITYLTDKNNTGRITIERELDVELYLDRVEECHGYHQMWEVTDSEVDRAIEDFIDDFDDIEIVEEWAEDNLAYGEHVTKITLITAV